MSWIAVLLLGVAVTDLVRSLRPTSLLPEAVGAVVAVFAGLTAGLTGAADLVALMLVAGVVVAWGQPVWRATEDPRTLPAPVPLAVLGAALVLLLVLSGLATPAGGVLQRWRDASDAPVLRGGDAGHVLLLLALGLFQLSTGNVLVRLVLDASHTVDPTAAAASQPQAQLRGGRLLGPMERLFILGLGMAGHATAAAVVIAAKGLLRFPELQAKRGNGQQVQGAGIDEVTEYFLVGSFVSWLVALASLVLVAG